MSVTDGWRFYKLARAFNRAFDDERADLPAAAVTSGDIVKGFLFALGEPAMFRHAGTRADAVLAIDQFMEARRG